MALRQAQRAYRGVRHPELVEGLPEGWRFDRLTLRQAQRAYRGVRHPEPVEGQPKSMITRQQI